MIEIYKNARAIICYKCRTFTPKHVLRCNYYLILTWTTFM